jgi:hypothetical protein
VRPSKPGRADIAKRSIVKLRIRTREQRYILDDAGTLERTLRAHGAPYEFVLGRPVTEITTIYFDTPEGTWSVGRSQTKLRARSYQDPDRWWFEVKRREGTTVDKWRRPLTPEGVRAILLGGPRWKPVARLVGTEPLRPLFGVRCQRTAFEWPGLRVTLDREVTFFAVEADVPFTFARRLGAVAGVVVEVKQEAGVPEWLAAELAGREARGYSKSRYALAALERAERAFLLLDSELPTTLPIVGGGRPEPLQQESAGG